MENKRLRLRASVFSYSATARKCKGVRRQYKWCGMEQRGKKGTLPIVSSSGQLQTTVLLTGPTSRTCDHRLAFSDLPLLLLLNSESKLWVRQAQCPWEKCVYTLHREPFSVMSPLSSEDIWSTPTFDLKGRSSKWTSCVLPQLVLGRNGTSHKKELTFRGDAEFIYTFQFLQKPEQI